ncbi:MAG: esterase-like activity of phytase family protein [Halobacteriovoraceae bacterium]|nr:esterase-like activity of phytase family protein [Halobacteriovoraceae bacterium]
MNVTILRELFNDLNQIMKRFLPIFLLFLPYARAAVKFQLYKTSNFIEIIPYHTKFKNFIVGGLSDLTCQGSKLLAISDDRGDYGPLRIFEFENDQKINLTNVIQIGIKNSSVDFEGLTQVGSFYFATSEGQLSLARTVNSYLFKFDQKGNLIKKYPFPSAYNISPFKGIRDNSSFESLTYNQSKNFIITALENSLIQDDQLPNFEEKTDLRILQFDLEKERFKSETFYQLEKLKKINNQNTVGSLGLVALEHLKGNYYLSLERAWIPKIKKNFAQLFLVEITDHHFAPVKNHVERSLRKYVNKTLIGNIEDFITPSELKNIDNVEGLCVSPLKDGEYKITLVTDNNFNKYQQTIFFHFLLKEVK